MILRSVAQISAFDLYLNLFDFVKFYLQTYFDPSDEVHISQSMLPTVIKRGIKLLLRMVAGSVIEKWRIGSYRL